MGTVASIYCSQAHAHVVLFKKGGDSFVFEDSFETQQGKYRFPEVYLSYLYPDIISETIRVPPIKDEQTIGFIIRKKLADRLRSESRYIVVFEEVPEESTKKEKTLRVFAIPENIYNDKSIVPEDIEDNLMLFTTPQFSLHAISEVVAKDRSVLHAYADGMFLIMTVSQNGRVVYTRSLSLPSYTQNDEEAYSGFIEENLSMTYMFVAQRSGMSVDFILLSGNLYDKDRLADRLLSHVACGIAVPLVPREFKGAEQFTFLKLLPCFGNLLLDQKYDFSPADVKERRIFRVYMSRLIPFLIIILMVSLSLLGFKAYKLWKKTEEVAQLRNLLLSNLPVLSQNPTFKDISYYVDYVKLLTKSEKENPLNVLNEVDALLKYIKAKEYTFSYKDGKVFITLKIEKNFGSMSDLSLYREKLIKKIEETKRKGFSYRIAAERRDIAENKLYMEITLEKKI